MKQYFIADTHFGHDKYHSENWEYKFWKKYNSINQDFILYHLGDLSFIHNHKYLDEIFEKFRKNEHCKNIVLILGNHDFTHNNKLKKLFVEVVPYKEMKDKVDGKEYSLVLSHYPIMMWNGQHRGTIHLYGHVHNSHESELYKRFLTEFS